MVMIIPKVPSFGEQMGASLGKGLSQGIAVASQQAFEAKRSKELGNYFKDLSEKNPQSQQYKLFSDVFSAPNLGSVSDRTAIIKSLSGYGDPYRALQQKRLLQDTVLKRYNTPLKEIDEAIKTETNYDEMQRLEQLRKGLRTERDQMLNAYGLGLPQEEKEPGMADFFEEGEEEKIAPKVKRTAPKKAKTRFDASNPVHKARRDQVLKKTGGDRRKAGLILAKEFEL